MDCPSKKYAGLFIAGNQNVGPSAHGQDLEKELGHLDFPGSSWLTSAAPASAEVERKVRKHLASSSEPILDLKTEVTSPATGASVNTAEIISLIDLECPPIATVVGTPIFNVPLATQDPAQIPKPPWDFSCADYCDPELPLPPPPDKVPPSETGSTGSLPWPEAPDDCVPAPVRPNTLDILKPLQKLEEVKQIGERRSNDNTNVKENGLENCPEVPRVSEERKALQSELGKCIEDFRKIKIPSSFPNKTQRWQHELLKKYQL
ncbi:uncharacterized protein LOC125442460 [Sphaerodactylus townsendi]|uniref:uncharacterized protein LOC125442460 n=1 Tax=Sphaerodactylus townsendi TaxID=933632 RepID=UPI0020265581|nr:uncharacterized protein LOC125442460 [Sphaerodactylus townsendi]